MMSVTASNAAMADRSTPENGSPASTQLNDEDQSKDAFFVQVAEIAEAMIARHGKEFAMGTLILSARFIAENKPLIKRDNGGNDENAPAPVLK
jgi:hypothetical protein